MPAIMQFHGKDYRGKDMWRVYKDYDRMNHGTFVTYTTEKQAQKAIDEINGVVKPKKTEAEIRASYRVEHATSLTQPGKEYFTARGGFGPQMLLKDFSTREEAEAKVAKALKAALKRGGY